MLLRHNELQSFDAGATGLLPSFRGKLFFSVLLVLTAFVSARADTVTVILIRDIQGEVVSTSPWDTSRGRLSARRWAALASRSKQPNTVLLDMGNTYFPGYLSRFSAGRLTGEIVSITGISTKLVTAEDLLLGRRVIDDLRERASSTFISGNMQDVRTGNQVFAPYDTLMVGGNLLTVTGFSDPGRKMIVPGWDDVNIRIEAPRGVMDSLGEAVASDTSFDIVLLQGSSSGDAMPQIPGADVFAVEMEDNAGFRRSYEVLENGTWVLHVPALFEGVGVLKIVGGNDKARALKYHIADPLKWRPDSIAEVEIRNAVSRWTSLYLEEVDSIIAVMDTALGDDQALVVANFLREWRGNHFGAVHRETVTGVALPETVTVHDLNSFLREAPDLVEVVLTGSQIRDLARDGNVVVGGVEGGRFQGRHIRSSRRYSLITTETVWTLIKEKEWLNPKPSGKRLFVSLFDVLRDRLSESRAEKYAFDHLKRKPHLFFEPEAEFALRRVDVYNPDSVLSFPGASYEPFFAWDVSAEFPVTIANAYQEVVLSLEPAFAAAGDKVGKNDLETTLEYAIGPWKTAKPYLGAYYDGYIMGQEDKRRPVGVRFSGGIQVTASPIEAQFGMGTSKSIRDTARNPLVPLRRLFIEDEPWGPSAELNLEGQWDLGQRLEKANIEYFRGRGLEAAVSWENIASVDEEVGRVESTFEAEIVAEFAPYAKVKIGWELLYGYVFRGEHLFNSEPSLELTASYSFGW